MSFVFDGAHKLVLDNGLVNLNLYGKLVMGDEYQASTVPDEPEADFLSDFSAILEYDGSNYEEQPLEYVVATTDKPNDRANVTLTAPLVFGADGLGPGLLPAIGLLVYHKVTNDADSVPVFYFDTGGFPVEGRDEPITIPFPNDFARLREAAAS